MAALSVPLSIGSTALATSASSLAGNLPPPIIFPGTGIGASFSSYAALATPWSTNFSADVFDRCYFPGQKAQLALTQHYKGSTIKAINVWNEPWEGGGISGWGGTGQTYRHMIKGVYDAVKSVDPSMLVGGDEYASTDQA